MDLDALRFANFSQLDTAIDDWSTMVDDLATLKDDADKGLQRAANKANWAGYNATVSKEFIGKTAGEFWDAHTQAKSIWNILRDTRNELKKYQDDLNDAIDRGLKKNLTVVSTGNGGFTVTMNIHPDRAAKGTAVPEHDESDVTALRDEVQRILNGATESDNTASTALKAIADQSAVGFSDANYKDRDSADEAIKKADELAKLAKKDPEKLTPAEFDKLNDGLEKYANDPLFSERFATDLGPKGTLEFWAGINDPHKAAQLGQGRVDQYDELQRNLSLTLASATQSDSATMTDWKSQMIALGDKPIGGQTGPMGFQVMSNLMRAGDYDDAFLKSYGTALMATERKLTGNGEHANMAWQHMGMDTWLNRMGEDSGDDPLTGYLKALSSSPDAATDFFNEEYLPKDDDHKSAISNFKYLFEDREWPQETNLKGDEIHPGQNNLAMALEAATTGHPAGELPTADTPAHNEQQANLMASVVKSISEDPGRLTDKGYMSDSIGQMASEYLPDINRATTDVKPDPNSEPWQQIEKLFPVAGASAQMDHADVSRFLISVGQNPEGYSAVEVGQKAYMANLMDYHLNPDLPQDQRYNASMEDTVKEISRRSAEIGGSLAIGRQEAVLGPAKENDDAYNHAVSQWQNVASGVVGTGIGVGTSFIASPAGGAAAGGAAGTVTSVVLGELFQDVQGSDLEGSGLDSAKLWEDSRERNIALAQLAAAEAAKAHHSPHSGQVGGWALDATQNGFNDASTNGRHMADDLETEIP
ncbi:hypothetical protein [Streptomyces sp. NL15-2K]|uniref:hypothetical protein n=1 Tax=Streptomyces sp. NL15-2K TaxID=376149 RepID=UPI000F560040|nr:MULTISPECIES: hypothetical protein [Actinomycetes]WKX13083.1 hypothetical protein Q4V64_38385 [Kutzneria buriramensis]GCB45590.1 hypothetical protein SNL152K_2881 [Streptomyces sp. NL15-2K]